MWIPGCKDMGSILLKNPTHFLSWDHFPILRTGTWPTRKDSTWEKSKEWGSELSSRVCMTDWKWRVPNMTGFSSRTTSEKLRRLNQASKKQISCNLVVFGGKVLLEGSPVSNTQPVSLSRHLSARFCCKARGYQVKLKTSKAQVTLKQALRCGSRFTKFLNKMPELNWSRSVLSDSLRPVDYSPPGSSVHGILQARILEWVAISFSRGSSQPRDRTKVSRSVGRHFNLWATREGPNKMPEKETKVNKMLKNYPSPAPAQLWLD